MLTTSPPRPAPARPTKPRPATTVAHTTPTAPPLRVVTDAELRDARRRLRARRATFAGAGVVALALFGIVIAHVLLMQGQFELQQLQERSAESQAEYDRLRLQVSELESPDRVVAVAQEKLGMVAPPKITYLAPVADPTFLPAASAAPSTPSDTTAGAAAAPPVQWSSVKSHLADG
ncbi:MAG TPA: cell division protein FtsL [Acidimicrobiales bacterium]